LLFEFGSAVWETGLARFSSARRYLVWALCLLVGLGVLLSLPFLGSAYARRQLEQEPARDVIGYLLTSHALAQSDQLLIDDQELVRRLNPYLSRSYRLRLVGGEQRYLSELDLTDLAAGARGVWVLSSQVDTKTDPGQLSRLGRALLTYYFEGGYRLELFSAYGNQPVPPPATLANGVQLIAYRVEQLARNQVSITLYWWAASVPPQDYTVFTQVLDENGTFVSGHDGTPMGGSMPTHTWQVGYVYADTHLIELSRNLPAGHYRVIAGMYDAAMTRVSARSPDGQLWPDNAVVLETMVLP